MTDSSDEKYLWNLINYRDFKRPPWPKGEKFESRIKSILSFFYERKESQPKLLSIDHIKKFTREKLDELAPEMDVNKAVAEIRKKIEQQFSDENNMEPLMILYQPFSFTSEIVEQFAEEENWNILKRPSADDIYSGDFNLILNQAETGGNDAPFFIPGIENYFIRSYRGFNLVRDMLGNFRRSGHKFLVTCNSWSWEFLKSAAGIESYFSNPLILETFGSKELEQWFSQLLQSKKDYVFRQADNGDFVLDPVKTLEMNEEEPGKYKKGRYLEYLASYSLGIPEVARAIWRMSLGVAAEEEIETKALKKASADVSGKTVWVEPVSGVDFPKIPGDMNKNLLSFLLYSLLIHSGLAENALFEILPFSDSEIARGIHKLKHAGVIKKYSDTWFIHPLAYPNCRKYLSNEGFLTDS